LFSQFRANRIEKKQNKNKVAIYVYLATINHRQSRARVTPMSIINVSLDSSGSKRQSCKQIAKIMWGCYSEYEYENEDKDEDGSTMVFREGCLNHKSWQTLRNSLNGFCQTKTNNRAAVEAEEYFEIGNFSF